ncbi:SEC12-like protein 2 isoform X2 [Pyrus x bretschneideri]|uniref:SEC12-like protein 2 isoform X2 n=1 Tax=Pyrus x bretschneideri TaxID=225117 RepID=UPI0020302F36|nr:SEC12-like protein 2 isoform X2 [Pyrus x bretschneideri]
MDTPNNYQKYGVPFYAAAWLPGLGKSKRLDQEDDAGDDKRETETQTQKTETQTELAQFDSSQNHVVFSGGGGEGRSGVPNAILIAQFDPASISLSNQPVAKLNTGSALPYRMAVHPAGSGLVCSFPDSCRWFELEEERDEVPKLALRQSGRMLEQLQDVGQQLALAFDRDGSMLAAGGEDGKLRVFKWPSMEIILDEAKAHTTMKQLDFSPDGKFLVSLGDRGPGRVWDVTSSTVVASLPAQKDEFFCGCRFSVIEDGSRILYVADKSGSIVTWNTTTWKRIGSKIISRDIISAFDVSADGKLLGCGTAGGDLVMVNPTRMRIHKVVKKAHMGLVTALSFSHDSRALASASMDSSARVSTLEEEKKNGVLSLWVIILIILVAIAVYFQKNPDKLPSALKGF